MFQSNRGIGVPRRIAPAPGDVPATRWCRPNTSSGSPPFQRFLLKLKRRVPAPKLLEASRPSLRQIFLLSLGAFFQEILREFPHFFLYVRWKLAHQFFQRFHISPLMSHWGHCLTVRICKRVPR